MTSATPADPFRSFDDGGPDDAGLESPFARTWALFRRDRLAMFGLWVLIVLALFAVLGKVLTEWYVLFDPATVRLSDKLQPPLTWASAELAEMEGPFLGLYLLGTDDLGRDVVARMLQGSFVSLSIGFIAVGISTLLGIILGGLAGYYDELKIGPFTLDSIIMRFTDLMLCFPTFFLILTVIALLPASIYNIMIVIGVTSWMPTARFVRAEFLSLKSRDFVVAAQASGLPEWAHHLRARHAECAFSSSGVRDHRRCHGDSYRIRIKLPRLWRSTALRHLGQYSIRRQGLHLRCALAVFRTGICDLGCGPGV